MEIIQAIQLTLDTEPPFYRLKMRQTDGARQIKANIWHNSTEWQPPTGSTAEFRAVKPDGKKQVKSASIQDDGVLVQVDSQTLAKSGIVQCEIVFLDTEGTELGSVSFELEVWEAAVTLSDIASNDDYQTLQQAVTQAQGYRDEAGQYAADASASEAVAQMAATQAEAARDQYPVIDASTTYWKVWDATQGQYIVTAYPSRGEKGDTGAQGTPGEQGPVGPAGKDGTSFSVLGLYPTLSALQAAHPTGNAGDGYAVGTASDNVVYIWDTGTGEWVSVGAIQGPQGVPGPQGEQGPKGDPAKVNGKMPDENGEIILTAADVGAAPTSHVADKNNPHEVTAAQAGAAPVSHTTDTSNPHQVTAAQVGAAPVSHTTDTSNPHGVTAAQVGAEPADITIMKTGTAQVMTAQLTAGGSMTETTPQVRNSVIVASTVDPSTLDVAAGTIIYVKEA